MTVAIELPSRVEGRHVTDLRHALLAAVLRDPVVVVGCAGVTHLSPGGQALLVGVDRAARRRGGHLYLQRPAPALVSALQGTGLIHLLGAALAPGRP